MKRVLCVILACVLLLAGCSRSEKDWQEQYDLGMRYLSEGDYEEAILAFSAAIEIDDRRPEAYMGRAEAYEAIGDLDKALKDYKKARKIVEENEDYEDLLEDLEEIIGELEESIEETEDAADSAQPGGVTMVLTGVEIRKDDFVSASYELRYNGIGQLLERIYTEHSYGYSTTFAYTYDEEGRLVLVSWGDFGREEWEYDSDGRLIWYYYAEGGATSTTYEYDNQGRLIREYSAVDTGDEEILYTYDDRGLRTGATMNYTEWHGGDRYSGTITYEYDFLNRLLAETVDTDTYYNRTEYTYYENAVIENSTSVRGEDQVSGWARVRIMDTWSVYVYDSIVSVEEQDGRITSITDAGGMTYLFTYEALAAETEMDTDTEKELGLYKPLMYEIIREDRSYYDADGIMRIERYYDKVVILGDRPEFAAMNAAIESDMEGFFSILDGEDLSYYISFLSGTDYLLHTADVEVTDNSGEVFSYCISTGWFMGGVYNGDHYGVSFDVSTGEAVDLPTLFGVTEAEMCQMMKDAAWSYLSANHSGALWDGARDTVYGYELDDFFYYFRDGELIITFPTYTISYGAAGSFTVPTGLYY